jgi:hypothetical protein
MGKNLLLKHPACGLAVSVDLMKNGMSTLKLAIGDFVACPKALSSTGMKFSRS